MHELMDIFSIQSDPGQAADAAQFAQGRTIQRPRVLWMGLRHGIKKSGILANGGFVIGNAVDLGNRAARGEPSARPY